ncbi:hypothetical protein AAIP55_000816 [Flavobacterium psychrophilum]|uniref:phage major capsid protein n=1 Tax=Flavobacterium psychrophilum TaxID=96345 RepID=UPI000618780A|nr:hypothetical protein [Flavobacterium psychrophilum]EKT3963237.1 hypothetical protein [Flavobacterium psychrophilum]EKT4516692.1 hypothetical protein [Flavobacterium psychrophilum]ELM3649594.1 hypothetical protein [Flavobacterium psychrophilum]ELM3670358.1 hypothetical protein [Flavobacterium psychrophilum]ELM3725314.1 hypothetical protein [Flavobacterium psychrophilum]
MPANFADVWLNRVIQNLSTQNVAPWLDGIPELDTTVAEMGSGEASEMNVIHIPRTNFNPNVLVNNTAYPIALQAYTDDEVVVTLDKYVTEVTTLSDDKIIGASYNVIDPATNGHVRAINAKKFKKAIHAIAPTSDTASTPVIVCTGDVVNGLPTLRYEDLVALKERLDLDEVSAEGRRLVLSTTHYNNLLLDRKNFGDKLVNYNTGMPAPVIASFELFQYAGNPSFTSAGVKKAFGAIKATGDRQASVAFWTGAIAKKTGMTKQYFADAKLSPTTQSNQLNYRHYFIAVPFEAKGVAAIY